MTRQSGNPYFHLGQIATKAEEAVQSIGTLVRAAEMPLRLKNQIITYVLTLQRACQEMHAKIPDLEEFAKEDVDIRGLIRRVGAYERAAKARQEGGRLGTAILD